MFKVQYWKVLIERGELQSSSERKLKIVQPVSSAGCSAVSFSDFAKSPISSKTFWSISKSQLMMRVCGRKVAWIDFVPYILFNDNWSIFWNFLRTISWKCFADDIFIRIADSFSLDDFWAKIHGRKAIFLSFYSLQLSFFLLHFFNRTFVNCWSNTVAAESLCENWYQLSRKHQLLS